jgi:hypothetical protein
MNHFQLKSSLRLVGTATAFAALLAFSLSAHAGDSINVTNPSFEQGYNPTWPHYATNLPMAGWNASTLGIGINDSTGPFWDNGNLVDSTYAGFIQADGLMGQSQTGFAVGQTYWLQLFANARTGTDTPDMTVYHSASTAGGAALLSYQNIVPAGMGNPFFLINIPFTAAAASGDLNILKTAHNGGGGAATLVLDGISIIARATNDIVIANPSFEASGTGQAGVGVVGAVAGWDHFGINPPIINQAGGPYLDNGTVPDGNNVLVLQNDSGYSQTLHGLTPGQIYRLTLYLNSRNGTPATALVTIDGQTAFNGLVSQVGGSNPYHFISYDFTASAADVTLSFANQNVDPSTLFVDNLRVYLLEQTPPTVLNQPVNATNYVGGTLALVAVIDGFPAPRVQWKHEGVAVAGATNQTLTLNALQFADAGSYVLYATNGAGWTNTTAAMVTVLPTPPDSIAVANPSFEDSSVTNTAFPHYGVAASWAASAAGVGVNDSTGPFWDNGLLPDTAQVAFMQHDGIMGQHQTGFQPGKLYWIQVFANARVDADTPDLSVYHSASSLGGAPLLVNQNIAPVGAGNPFVFVNVPFTAAATAGDFNFQKLAHGGPSDNNGGLATLVLDGISIIRRTTNDIVIANPSFEASGTNQTFPGAVLAAAGWDHSGTAPVIINQAGGPYLDNGTIPDGNNVLVLQDSSTVSQTLHGLTPSQTYRLTLYVNSRSAEPAPATALITIDGNTALNGVVSQVGGNNPYHLITYDFEASSADVVLSIGNQFVEHSSLLVDNVRVFALVPTAPSVSLQPIGGTRWEGATITLSAAVDGFPAPQLQWKHGGVNVANGTAASLTLSALRLADAGSYVLYATNAAGWTASSAATVSVLAAPAAGTYASMVFSNSPMGYWRFSDGGGTNAYDYAGGNDAFDATGLPLQAGPRPPAFPGFESTNTAPFLNGTNNGSASSAKLFNGLSAFTLMGWFKIDPSQYPIVDTGTGGAHPQGRASLFGQEWTAELGFYQGTNLYFYSQGISSTLMVNTGFTPGQWCFVAAVSDPAAGTTTLYLNGVVAGTADACPGTVQPYLFSIGKNVSYFPEAAFFPGSIDEVAAFDHALPASTIQNIYLKGYPGANTLSIGKSGNNLELAWSFGRLVSSTNLLTGPWLPVAGAISPQLVAPSSVPRFYRTVIP